MFRKKRYQKSGIPGPGENSHNVYTGINGIKKGLFYRKFYSAAFENEHLVKDKVDMFRKCMLENKIYFTAFSHIKYQMFYIIKKKMNKKRFAAWANDTFKRID